MPLHEPANPSEPRDPVSEYHNARLGVWLFVIYTLGYSTFVVASAFSPFSFDAVSAGMGLIVGAFVMSLIYMALCKAPKAGRS